MLKTMLRSFVLVLLLAFTLTEYAGAATISISPDASTATNVSVTCANTATLLLAGNGKRRSWVALAPPTNTITVYIGFSSGVTTSNGLAMNANNTLSDNTYVGAVYCIAASATSPLIVAETSR